MTRRILPSTLFVAVRTLLAALLLSLSVGCTHLFFQPYGGYVRTPTDIGLTYENVEFEASDGVTLRGWFLPAKGAAKGTILFLHGNAENISTHIGSVFWLPAEGFNVFLLDYRGYGLSDGEPELPGVLYDTDGAIRTLLARPDVDRERIILFGQSLGGALAVYTAAHSPYRQHIRAVVIDSTFSSYRDIAREALSSFWLTWPFRWPLSFTITDAYSPLKAIPKVSPIPVLIIHSKEDPVVRVHHADKLFNAAREPKAVWILPNGAHIQTVSRQENRSQFVQRLSALLDRKIEATDHRAMDVLAPVR